MGQVRATCFSQLSLSLSLSLFRCFKSVRVSSSLVVSWFKVHCFLTRATGFAADLPVKKFSVRIWYRCHISTMRNLAHYRFVMLIPVYRCASFTNHRQSPIDIRTSHFCCYSITETGIHLEIVMLFTSESTVPSSSQYSSSISLTFSQPFVF